MQLAILRVTVFLPWCFTIPVPPDTDHKGWDFVKDYFHRFFLTKKESQLETQTQLLQQFHQNGTGLLDMQMHAMLHQPRCGVPDGSNTSILPGRSKWDKYTLTYRIINYPHEMKPSTVKDSIYNAVSIWSSVTPLVFQQVQNEEADIKISFWQWDHEDCWPFDGPGGFLGHAFLPNSGNPGVVHFDKDEHWSASNTGFNLFLVATHEIGHSLGLKHSGNRNSIMYPTYWYHDPRTFHLSADDIQRIQDLYGEKCSAGMP
ncbi:matrix metalloproteinase-26 [Saimiri boliviensis]|uniref:Matrix metallopeptidase 26 n=1 Tax=Saimiri boliviensis boliviensis TaxID=39432 RepID=A0A2K6TMI9_SAIBB|nr:matrix metalloproteinase-26 [Saimiri boliviensis boliviensis]